MALSLKDTDKALLTVTFLDQAGNPAVNPGPGLFPAWQTTDPTICEIQPVLNTNTAWAVAATKLGNAVITAACGGIQSTFTVTVVAGDAASLVISAGAPTHQ